MKVHIEFDRLGRNHDPEPLIADLPDTSDGAVDLLAVRDVVYEHARKHLLSRDLDVYAERQTNLDGSLFAGNPFQGTVYAGFHVAGEFKGREVTE